ncbi:YceI family protein [Thalassotalea euphylliae]|uniref:YceI family protein n=1 Tax=Thalassotalea euphylliae TaxID=1655234 RepID=UPI00362DB483
MRIPALLLSSLLAFPALSAWQLDNNQSTINFVSTKKGDIAEIHKFDNISGAINEDGKVTFTIDLASVNTGIGIRDERMAEFLFETSKFTSATFTTTIDLAFIKGMPKGVQKQVPIEGEISLHGKTQTVKTLVQVVKLTRDRLLVNSTKPLILNAAQFDLTAGVTKLKELAGLPSISNAVPVTFNLTFADK